LQVKLKASNTNSFQRKTIHGVTLYIRSSTQARMFYNLFENTEFGPKAEIGYSVISEE